MLGATTVRRQRRAATSSDELQPSACRGGGLRDPKGRKSSAQITTRLSPHSFRFGLSPTPPRRSAPGRQGRRFGEPQKHGQFVFGRSQRRTKTERKRSISALRIRGLRADRCHRDLATRSHPKFQPKARPNSPPRVCLTAAPLSLRRVLPSPAAILAGLAECQPAEYALSDGRATDFCAESSFVARLTRFIYIRLTAEIVESLLKAWRAAVLREGTALGPGGPHVPWTGNAYAFQLAASAQPIVRAQTLIFSRYASAPTTASSKQPPSP